MNPDYIIRSAEESDIPFIYSSFLNCIKYDSAVGLSVRKGIFFENYRTVIDSILRNENCNVLIACKPDETKVIFSFLVFEPTIIHFVFVKESFRNFGIAKALFNQAFLDYKGDVTITHRTQFIESLLRNHAQLVYNPFVLYRR